MTASPAPTIAFILHSDYPAKSVNAAKRAKTTADPRETGMQAYSRLQLLILAPPSTGISTNSPNKTIQTNPIPILPIPSPSHLLSFLKSYTAPPRLPPLQQTPKKYALHHLLPHITTTAPARPLTQHTVNVLSDLCHSIREVAWICEREEGRTMLREWIGEKEADAVVAFWGDERVVGE